MKNNDCLNSIHHLTPSGLCFESNISLHIEVPQSHFSSRSPYRMVPKLSLADQTNISSKIREELSPSRITVYNEAMGPNRLKFGIGIHNLKIILLAFIFHWPKQIIWPCLNSKRTGKCCAATCLEGEENQKNYEQP